MPTTISGSTGLNLIGTGNQVTYADSSIQNTSPKTGFVNRIINGGMTIDQRNAGASVSVSSPSDTYVVDRFFIGNRTGTGVFSGQQSTTAPSGFKNSIIVTTTTANASLGASEYGAVRHIIEGLNVADLGWGTASAQPVTISFWVRSSLTGTFGGSITNGTFNRSYPFTYTISAANTYEYKTVTIAGDTTGTWATDNGRGITLFFGLGVGSTLSGTAGAWAGSALYSATGATSVVGTSGATFYITGVQLEKGSVATPFEFRSIGQELALCQRYFEKSEPQGVPITQNTTGSLFPVRAQTIANGTYMIQIGFAVAKRASPTVSTYPYTTATNLGRWSDSLGADFGADSASVAGIRENGFSVVNLSGGTIDVGAQIIAIGSWYASAEL